MDKFEKEIMVVPVNDLFNNDSFQGFVHHSENDFQSRILNFFQWMKRGLAEQDPNFKQPIAYCLIVNPELKKVFVYQRSTKAGEKRLHNMWSWGIGGHIDVPDLSLNKNPIQTSMLRELSEEIEIPQDSQIEPIVLGYINEDDTDVGKVHLGILYIIKTNATEIKPKDSEVAQGRLMHINELEEIYNSKEHDVETWSEIAFNPLKDFLNSL